MPWMDCRDSVVTDRDNVSKASFNMRINFNGYMAPTGSSQLPIVGYIKYTYYVTFRGQAYNQ